MIIIYALKILLLNYSLLVFIYLFTYQTSWKQATDNKNWANTEVDEAVTANLE